MKIPDNIKRKFYFVINLIGVLFIIYFVLAVFYFDVDENSEASDSEIEENLEQIYSPLFTQISPNKDQVDSEEENSRFENCEFKDYSNEILEYKNELLEKINESKSLDSQIAYMLISNGSNSDILDSFNAQHPDNKYIVWAKLQACANNSELKCSQSIIDDAVELDGQNGAVWLLIASIYAANESFEATNDALKKMYSSPIFDDYHNVEITAIDNALINAGIDSNSDRLVYIISRGDYTPNYYNMNLYKFCKKESLYMKDNDSICLETGNYLINNAKSIANKHFGFSIKKVIYSNNKEEKKVAELDYEIQNLFLSNYAFETSEDLLRLSLYDENLANFWLESFKQYNEIEANHRAIEEVERLSSDPDYNPCPTTID